MTNENSKQATDELTPAVRKALIECGAVIPVTPEEVLLLEKQITVKAKPAEIEAAFKKLEKHLDDPSTRLSFMRLDDSFKPQNEDEFSMAARKGCELDDETRAKIEASVLKALQKPPQDKS